MANFVFLAFVDVWALSSSLRTKLQAFSGEGAVRTWELRRLTDAGFRVHAEWKKWAALKTVLSRIQRLPINQAFEMGSVAIEMLEAQSVRPWGTVEGDGWQILHLPLVTNPAAVVIAGNEAIHMPIGGLTWVNAKVPTSAANMGEWPIYTLILRFRERVLADIDSDDPS